MKRLSIVFSCVALVALLFSCKRDEPDFFFGYPGGDGGSGNVDGGTSGDDVQAEEVYIEDYDGETADDSALDVVGTDEDLYWELNDFTKTVTVTFHQGSDAEVEVSDEDILYNVSGNYVTVDMLTNSVKGVGVIASGVSDDGQLKIYGEKKFKLTLAGLDLTCGKGPAINDQCKKRAFVHLPEGSSNYLTDVSSYSDEPYYLDSSSADSEDRKGCFFSEGNLIFSGAGTLSVTGKCKHGIATDGYFYMRPGVTVVVPGAAKNAIHVKGDEDDGIGIYVGGGLIYANVASTAGKCLKTDYNAEIAGGKLYLYTSGDSEYDADEEDTSSPAGIKTNGDMLVTGGTLEFKSTGTGGKGINTDGDLQIDGGTISIATSGAKFTYTSDLTSSPKGIKSDGDIVINGGTIDVSVTGKSDGSEGIESKSTLTINGGEISVYAYDDAINASSAITVNGGKVYSYSVSNDGIDSNGTLAINDGLVVASGTTAPEEGLDTDSSSLFTINGGTVIGTGGSQVSPSGSSRQRSVIYNGISATSGLTFTILDSSSNPIMTYELPRSMNNGMSLIYSGSNLVAGSYTVATGGTVSGYSDAWHGWYDGGSWSGGTTLGSFTSSGTVTTVGSSSGPGGGTGGPGSGGNNPGGGRH